MTDTCPTRGRNGPISLGALGIRQIRMPMSMLMLLGTSLALGGCGLDVGCGNATTETVTTTVPPVTAATVATGVVDTWAEAMQRLVGLLEGTPRPDAVRADVEDLKEEYIQRFVAYGRQRLELNDAGQEEMRSLTAQGLSALSEEPWFESYMSLYEHYSMGDVEFSDLLASFNILTQYADFDLLKQQAPEEAARLGIE
jgi:hypothetical protein